MRSSRPAFAIVVVAVLVAVCVALALMAVRLASSTQAPVSAEIPIQAAHAPAVPAAAAHTPPVTFGTQDFPALARLTPLSVGQPLAALDLLGPLTPETPPSLPAPLFRLPPGQKPLIAIVIDDMGPNGHETRRALRLSAPITFAFLPYAKGVRALAAEAKSAGHELIVHVPMQPLDSRQNPGRQALLTSLDPAEIRRRLAWNLAQFDGYVGINNHMGSRFTADAAGMRIVMAELAPRQLFFLDSRTIGRTAARATAAEHGVPLLERDVFLDDTDTAAAVAAQLEQTLRVARRQGKAIAIGHPRRLTLDALERWLPRIVAEGYQLVPLSRILAETVQTPARAASAETAHAPR